MFQKELLEYFEGVLERSEDETERELARRAVKNFTYAIEANHRLGQRWSRKGESKKWIGVTTQVDAEFHAKFQTFADERGLSLNRILRMALEDHLEANGWTI